MTSAMLLPTRIEVIYWLELRIKISAMKSNVRLCLRSISVLSRLALTKAISIPEKNADSVSIIKTTIIELTIISLLFAL